MLFALELISTDGWGQIFPKWSPPEKGMLMNIPKSFASNVLPPQQATFIPGGPPRPAVRFDPDSYGDCFALGPSAHESLCVPFKNDISVSLSPVELLCTSPTGLQCQMLQGLFLPVSDPHTGEFDVGLTALTPVGESL